MTRLPTLLRAALVACALAPALPALAAGNHDHAPRHGGIVSSGKEADYELVARPDALHLYVSDHGKLKDLAGASATVTLLGGGDKQEVQLAPANGRLEAVGRFKTAPGTQAVAVVRVAGKTLGTARFRIR